MAKKDNPDALTMSVPDAAKLLNLGRDATYRAARSGNIPSIVIGGRVLVLRKPLEAMLAGE